MDPLTWSERLMYSAIGTCKTARAAGSKHLVNLTLRPFNTRVAEPTTTRNFMPLTVLLWEIYKKMSLNTGFGSQTTLSSSNTRTISFIAAIMLA